MMESNLIRTQYLVYGCKTFTVMWCDAKPFKRFPVDNRAVASVALKPIPGEAIREGIHKTIPGDFCNNRSGRNGQGFLVALDDGGGRTIKWRHAIAIHQGMGRAGGQTLYGPVHGKEGRL